MRKTRILLCMALLLMMSATPALSMPTLFDWAFYVDGATYEHYLGDSMPTTGALDGNGLGTLSWSTSDVGSHTFIAFFDFEIDETANTFFNENGTAVGASESGQSWEIDEPGYVFGDIYDHVLDGTLDNTNAVPAGSEDDVSFALGWDFALDIGQTGSIDLALSQIAPASGFYLQQYDPDSQESAFFSSTLNVQGGGEPVPEPATPLLLGAGLIVLGAVGRKKVWAKHH
jgi:hypothetical protein